MSHYFKKVLIGACNLCSIIWSYLMTWNWIELLSAQCLKLSAIYNSFLSLNFGRKVWNWGGWKRCCSSSVRGQILRSYLQQTSLGEQFFCILFLRRISTKNFHTVPEIWPHAIFFTGRFFARSLQIKSR